MSLQKKEMYFVDANELIYGEDFDVVTDTPFIEGEVERLYGLDNHKINYSLIQKLNLGVVKNKYYDEYYIYNAVCDNIKNESIRLGIYYQITHPEFDDKALDSWIFGSTDGVDYILDLFGSHGVCVLSWLNDIFSKKKGNVLAFNPR
ncbi:hypothetical protein ACFOUV_00330 [Oceanobacillus longus]|uniref:Uncharacterized protein n=1 Tax=Oceanobacillus longus TaxID=930120 RepID=A0ABV8GTP8_9BACI